MQCCKTAVHLYSDLYIKMHFPFSALIDLNCKVLFPKLIRGGCVQFSSFIDFFVFVICIANCLNTFWTHAKVAAFFFWNDYIISWMFMNFSGFTKIQTFLHEWMKCMHSPLSKSYISATITCFLGHFSYRVFFALVTPYLNTDITFLRCHTIRRYVHMRITFRLASAYVGTTRGGRRLLFSSFLVH